MSDTTSQYAEPRPAPNSARPHPPHALPPTAMAVSRERQAAGLTPRPASLPRRTPTPDGRRASPHRHAGVEPGTTVLPTHQVHLVHCDADKARLSQLNAGLESGRAHLPRTTPLREMPGEPAERCELTSPHGWCPVRSLPPPRRGRPYGLHRAPCASVRRTASVSGARPRATAER